MNKERVLHLTKKDFIFQYFRAGGSGGQKQNKTSSGARVIHPPSGARGESREERSQHQNRKIAFERMANSKKFQDWLHFEHAKAIAAADEWLENQLNPDNLIIEYGPFDD